MNRFYFDHNATTPLSPEVLEAMTAALRDVFGNASSIHHYGQKSKQALEIARRQVATALGAEPRDVIFTGGGTEGDNLAVLGAVRHAKRDRKHVITTTIEHPAVLGACAQLEREGVDVTYVRVNGDGVVEPDEIRRAVRPDTVLISVMHANNELGTVQPLAQISAIAKEAGALFHSDGVQALGKTPVDVNALGVDLYSISGHKVYAPKGVGALFVRRDTRLAPIMFGGHHERDLRPGTENVPSAAALGRACAWISENLAAESERLRALRQQLESGIRERIPAIGIHGENAPRTPNTSNIHFEGIESEALLIALDLKGFAVSSGAACSSGSVEPSHVLTAIGLPKEQARASLRISLGRSNDAAQVDAFLDALVQAVEHLRRISPAFTAGVS